MEGVYECELKNIVRMDVMIGKYCDGGFFGVFECGWYLLIFVICGVVVMVGFFFLWW